MLMDALEGLSLACFCIAVCVWAYYFGGITP
jgi:hypothetical protein